MILHLDKKQFKKTHKLIHKVKLDFGVSFVIQNLEEKLFLIFFSDETGLKKLH